MHIEAWVIWEQVIVENAVETGAIVICQEYIMGSKLRIDPINSPIKHDSRARVFQALQSVSLSTVRQKVGVDIR